MNPNLLFNFTVNKEDSTIHVQREFAAGLDLVWDAWTKPEILDQWWAPKPYRVETKSMDFREGGRWFYAMISPENEAHWCLADYKKIELKKSYTGLDAFCDEAGNINTDFPRSLWTNVFQENKDTTTVNITIKYESLTDLEKNISLGFQEGFTMAMGNLDQYIEEQFRLRKQYKSNNSARVTVYLNFPGNTEEALNFYKSVFKTEFIGPGIKRFGDIPPDANHPPVADKVKKMVLHAELPLIGNHLLMASDAPKEMGFAVTQGNNMHINLEPKSREEAKRIFDALSVGGNVTMPIQDTFWGAYFGAFTDKFGINWMVNHQLKN
jgi:uncharacterized glyoxalase superfamily protein PhnB/uncharacterized protein YndB with AHSA1/START domain